MFMKKKQWYEAPEAEVLDIRLEASILSKEESIDGNGGENLNDPITNDPWS